nr:hypothetical protein [Tanacetum cinerariifolium]
MTFFSVHAGNPCHSLRERDVALDLRAPMIAWDLHKIQGAGLKRGERLMDLEHSFSNNNSRANHTRKDI